MENAPTSFFLTLIFIVLSVLVTVISRMLIFEKAGRSNVSAFIPFLNFYVMLRITGMKKIWTVFYGMTLLNIFLTIKALGPLLLPDEIVHDRFSLLSFILPIFYHHGLNFLFWSYWVFNIIYFVVYIRLHIRLAEKFSKSKLFGIGMGLMEPIFYPVVAFGKAKFKNLPV